MLEKNKVYRARIQGYTSEGLGVARIDGQAVFVHQALRGEECDILVLKVLKNAAFGKAVRVYAPSPHRREPDCPYYGRCGGCDFRHMDREEELEAKRQRVQDALRRIGGSDVAVEGILSGAPLHYRNKSQYPVGADGSIGFFQARTHKVVPIRRCLIQTEAADRTAPGLEVAALSEDGIVEALEKPDARFCLGVQWHPEWLSDADPAQQGLFDAFVEACRG